MAITSEFNEAVQSGNMMRVHIMLKNSLLVDPTGAQFDEMADYAESKMGTIYVAHDGEALNFDQRSWDKAYLNKQMVSAVTCFSKERIRLLKQMVRVLYKEKAAETRQTGEASHSQQYIRRKQIGTGVSVAGVIAAAAGIYTSHTVLTVGGIAAAAAGIIMLATNKEN